MGLLTTYNNTSLQPRVVMDRILMQDPYDIPVFTALGMVTDGFSVDPKGTKIEWFEQGYAAKEDALNGAINNSVTTVVAATSGLYQPGMVIQIESEKVWVSAVSGASLTVTRGYGDTSAASHDDATAIYIVGMARLEGDDADDSPNLSLSNAFNYTQILQHTVKVSGSAKVGAQYANYDPWDTEIDGAMESLMLLLERLPFYGERLVGSASTPRGAGGFGTFLSSNVSAKSNAALTRKHVEDMLQAIYDDGGDPDLIITNAWGKRKLNDLYEGHFERVADNRFEGFRTDWLENPISGRPLETVVSRHCPAGYMYFLSRGELGFIPYREFTFSPLAKTGDSEKGEVLGEWSFMVGVEDHHGLITGFNTSK